MYFGLYGGGAAAAAPTPVDGWTAESRKRLWVASEKDRLWIARSKGT